MQRRRSQLASPFLHLWNAYRRWSECGCIDLSAAFAYYTLQSIFPLLLIALAVAARIYGNGAGVNEVLSAIRPLLPSAVIDLVESTLLGLVAQGFGAGLLGVAVLFLTASNVYLTLQRGSDRLWERIYPAPDVQEGVRVQVLEFLKSRLEAYVVVLGAAALIVVEQILVSLGKLPKDFLSLIESSLPWLKGIVYNHHIFAFGSFLFPALWLSMLAFVLQRVLPSHRVPWRPLIPGALIIGVLLSALNIVLGLSIVSLGTRFQAYGVIGGVLILTLWVWLIGVIFYFGQCLSVELVQLRLSMRCRGSGTGRLAGS